MPSTSSPFTGSSSTTVAGSPSSSAAAMPSRSAMPRENLPGRRPRHRARPNRVDRLGPPGTGGCRWSGRARAGGGRRCGTGAPPRSSIPPTSCSGAACARGGRPLTVTQPLVGSSRPRIIRIVVDFPAPFGPRKPVTVPGRTVNVRSGDGGGRPVPFGQFVDLDHEIHGAERAGACNCGAHLS